MLLYIVVLVQRRSHYKTTGFYLNLDFFFVIQRISLNAMLRSANGRRLNIKLFYFSAIIVLDMSLNILNRFHNFMLILGITTWPVSYKSLISCPISHYQLVVRGDDVLLPF